MTPALATALPLVMAAAPAGPIGVAVSGGGDSVALLLLLQDWAAAAGRTVAAVTIDHGLRPESAGEAEAVARLCAARGIAHETLAWRGWDRRGNLQEAAREARRRLVAGWARARGIGAVALGHTREDQAETFLLRLARGSGVDGLAAMRVVSKAEGLVWLRPLLERGREELRDHLRAQGVAWSEDPSNADPVFERVRARRALEPLAALGLSPARLAETAARMARAREALEAATRYLARACLTAGPAGDLALDAAAFRPAPEEIRLRLLGGALCWVAGERFRPRLAALEAACAAVTGGWLAAGMTLHGCVLRQQAGRVSIRREPARVAPPVALACGVWDNRWAVKAPLSDGAKIGALGAGGLAARPRWREAGLAREALLATPALWRDGRLLAAPLLEPEGLVRVRRIAPLPPPWVPAD